MGNEIEVEVTVPSTDSAETDAPTVIQTPVAPDHTDRIIDLTTRIELLEQKLEATTITADEASRTADVALDVAIDATIEPEPEPEPVIVEPEPEPEPVEPDEEPKRGHPWFDTLHIGGSE